MEAQQIRRARMSLAGTAGAAPTGRREASWVGGTCSLFRIVQRLTTAPANWTGQSPDLPIPSSTLEDSPQLSSDLFKPSPVGFSFFLQNLGHLRGGPHLRFSVLLDFQIHHLFDQSGQRLRIHQFLSPDCIKISPDSNISVLTLDTVVRSSAQIRCTADVAPRRKLKNPNLSRNSSGQAPQKA